MVQKVLTNTSLFPSFSELRGTSREIIEVETAYAKKRLEVYSSFLPIFKRTKMTLDTLSILFPLLAIAAIYIHLPYLAASFMMVFIPITLLQRYASERAANCSVDTKRASFQWQQWGRLLEEPDLENIDYSLSYLRKEDRAIYGDFLPYLKYDLKEENAD